MEKPIYSYLGENSLVTVYESQYEALREKMDDPSLIFWTPFHPRGIRMRSSEDLAKWLQKRYSD